MLLLGNSTAGRPGLLARPSAALLPKGETALWGQHSTQPRPRASFRLAVSAAAQAKPLTAEAEAAAAGLDSWKQCRTLLELQLGLAPEDADRVLSDAFGWGSQAYWRQQKVQQPPSEEQVQQVLDFLAGLGITEAELPKVVQSFPQVLGCEQSLLKGNVEKLQKEWFMKGRALASTLVRKPAMLGCTIDCGPLGGCVSECNRCWARF